MKKSKLHLCLLLLLLSIHQWVPAQNKDSLVVALNAATNDTTRIKILSQLSEICDYNDIPKYAVPNKSLCEKAIADKLDPARFYLSNLGNAINNIGFYYSKKRQPGKGLRLLQNLS